MTRPEEHAECVWDEPMPPGDRVTARTFDDAVEHKMLTGVLDYVLEHLDEEVGDPNGEPTEPTDEMTEAERAFVKRILELYEPQGSEVVEIVEVDVEEWEARTEGSP